MKRIDHTALANRIAALELELKTIPHGPKTRERRQQLQRELLGLQEELENGPVPSYRPQDDPLYEGLWDEPEPEPTGPPQGVNGHFEPSHQDRAWWAQQPSRPLPERHRLPFGGPALKRRKRSLWGGGWTGRSR